MMFAEIITAIARRVNGLMNSIVICSLFLFIRIKLIYQN